MALHDDNSLVAVVVLPLIGGAVGLLILGPRGFFVGLVLLLVIGANMQGTENENTDRIGELEQRVTELENNEK